MEIPRLTTERLLLREWRNDDFEPFAAMSADAEVMRYLSPDGKPAPRHVAWRSMAMIAGHWVLRGYGNWVLEERATGRVVGRAGLWNPEGWPGLEVGWALAREHWNKGFATEAARASLDHAFRTHDVPKMISVIHPENARSIAVAIRLGMSFERETTVLADTRVKVYAITREEWQARA